MGVCAKSDWVVVGSGGSALGRRRDGAGGVVGRGRLRGSPSRRAPAQHAWVQTSAEYVISTKQVYSMATQDLGAALRDPDWNAVLEQGDHGGDLPPAIIVDIDETILNNAGHVARAIIARKGFVQEIWRAWVREKVAPAVPGAVDYLREAEAMGLRSFICPTDFTTSKRRPARTWKPSAVRSGKTSTWSCSAKRSRAGESASHRAGPGLQRTSGSCRSSGRPARLRARAGGRRRRCPNRNRSFSSRSVG